MAWVSSIARLTAGEGIAIEGKSLRGTWEAGRKAIVHMGSAWVNSNNLAPPSLESPSHRGIVWRQGES